MLLVGSEALKAHGIKLGRKSSDIDVIATMDELHAWYDANEHNIREHRHLDDDKKRAYFMKDKRIVEVELVGHPDHPNPTGKWLLDNYDGLDYPYVSSSIVIGAQVVHPDVVLTLKLSHRYLKNSPFFRKTMDDILALRGLKFRVPLQLQTWLKDRQKATLNYGHPSLKRDKGEFFSGDGIDYKYEHDDIHEAIAMMSLPAYKWFQKDPTLDVSVSREKWNECDNLIKLHSVLEESYVLALERSQIPCDFAIAPRTSFLIALEKVCTSITSGWWREYAWENYYRVLGMYNDDYVDRFQKALSEGRIRDYQGKNE